MPLSGQRWSRSTGTGRASRRRSASSRSGWIWPTLPGWPERLTVTSPGGCHRLVGAEGTGVADAGERQRRQARCRRRPGEALQPARGSEREHSLEGRSDDRIAEVPTHPQFAHHQGSGESVPAVTTVVGVGIGRLASEPAAGADPPQLLEIGWAQLAADGYGGDHDGAVDADLFLTPAANTARRGDGERFELFCAA